MIIQQLLFKAAKKLSKTSKSPALDSEVLLSFVLNKPKEYLYINNNQNLRIRKLRSYQKLIKKRTKGWPIAYLTGQKEFYGLNFIVNKNVLIPRPETEGLVDLVLTKIKNLPVQILNSKFQILDLGTGSGNIIISLAKTLSANSHELDHQYFSSDISKNALTIARKNAKLHKVKINFKQGSLLKPWTNKHFDIIVANLPYGWKEWKNNTSTETLGLKFEPRKALFTSKNGLALYEKFFEQIASMSLREARSFDRATKQSGPYAIFVEFDPRQTTQIKKLAKKLLPEYSLEIKKDLAQKNRFICLSL